MNPCRQPSMKRRPIRVAYVAVDYVEFAAGGGDESAGELIAVPALAA